MEDILLKLTTLAFSSQAVASAPVSNDLTLLVYPHTDGVIVGLGLADGAESRITPEEILRRRADNLDRLGAWLPAMFADGSIYVLRRVPEAGADGISAALSGDELAEAEELLA